jgi:hypothetical protein
MWSVQGPYNEILLVAGSYWRDKIEELGGLLENRQSKVVAEKMTRRLHSDLK